MQTSLFRRLAPSLAARFQRNQNHISSFSSSSSSSSSSVLHHATSSPSSPDVEPIHITENCVRKMKELDANESSAGGKMLRLSIETGGCSGFQYSFNLDDRVNSDDRVFEKEGMKLVVDNISYDFVKGATVDYVEELIRSAFIKSVDATVISNGIGMECHECARKEVTENPSAVGGCSCKSSFMVKQ